MDLEKELKKWREKRSQKPPPSSARSPLPGAPTDRRTVRVNGQEVVVVKKSRKSLS
jgi:hypothetical protein